MPEADALQRALNDPEHGYIASVRAAAENALLPPPLFTGCDQVLMLHADEVDSEDYPSLRDATAAIELTDAGREEVLRFREEERELDGALLPIVAGRITDFSVVSRNRPDDDVVVGATDDEVLALLDDADERRLGDFECYCLLPKKHANYDECMAFQAEVLDGAAADLGTSPIVLRPLRDRVLVELVDVLQQEGSIFTAATTEGATEYGRVVSVGPEVKNAELRPGTVVMFGKFSGYGLEGDQYMGLREIDLMFIVHGGKVRTKAERKAEADAVVREAMDARRGGGLVDASGRAMGSSGVAESARIIRASDADVVVVNKPRAMGPTGGGGGKPRKPRGGRGGKR